MRLVGALLCLLLLSSVGCCSDVTVHGGWLHTSSSNVDDSGVVGARVETPLYKFLSVGVEGMYHGQTAFRSEDSSSYGDISGISVLGELIAYPFEYKGIKPYVLGGWGWSWWDFDRSQDMEDRHIVIDFGDSFAQKYGVGAVIPLKGEWSLNIEWAWFKSMVPKDSYYQGDPNHYDGEFANVVGDDPKGFGVEECLLTVGIRRKF